MNSVSYIITIYNKAAFIPYMLAGLVAQEGNFDREYIFINDGSTDDSMAIVREQTQAWSSCIYIDQQNQGPAIATNRAVEKASGTYLKMLDADDVLAPYATKLLLQAIQKTGSALVYSMPLDINASIDYIDGISFPSEPKTLTLETIEDTLFHVIKNGMAGSSNLMVKADAFRDVGGCDESVFVQDWSLPIRIARKYSISVFRELIVYFPKKAPGRIMSNSHRMLHDLTATQANFIQQHPDLAKRYHKIAAKRCIGRAWNWAHRHLNYPVGTKYWWLYAANRIGVPMNTDWQMQQAIKVFNI